MLQGYERAWGQGGDVRRCRRSAVKPGRPARSGDRGVGRLPGAGRDRLAARTRKRRYRALLCAPRRSGAGQADRRACRFRLRIGCGNRRRRSEEHTSELQSIMRISYAVFSLKKKKAKKHKTHQKQDITTPERTR